MSSAISRRDWIAASGAGLFGGVSALRAQGESPQAPRRFRLGIVTYNIAARWDLPTVLRVCRDVGIAAVELRTTHRHGVEPTLTPAQRREVRQRFADSGVTFWGCGTTCEFHSPDPAVVRRNIETCRNFVRLVADLGGLGVKVRPNGLPRGVPVERTLAQIGRALRTCGEIADDAGIDICVEVHGRGTSEPERMQTIMQECGHRRVGITWNCNRTDIRNGSIREAYRMLRQWIRSVHLHDLFDFYPYAELFGLLRRDGYDRFTLAEIPGTPDVPTGERLLRYYKALWERMA